MSNSEALEMKYMVFGLQYNPAPGEIEESSMSVIVLGVFDGIRKATICRDIFADLDTTMESVTIVPVADLDDVPDYDIFLSITVGSEGIIIRSQCVSQDTEPWLRDDNEAFEALAYPEDKDHVISLASEWFYKREGYHPVITEDISGSARELIE